LPLFGQGRWRMFAKGSSRRGSQIHGVETCLESGN
jgi:hypothetical protein